MKSKFEVLVISLLLILISDQLLAQQIPADSEVKDRIQCIQTMLEQDKKGANLWWNGWLVGYGAGTVAQGAVYFQSTSSRTRQDMALGAATTILGAAGQLISPLNPGRQAEKLLKMSESTPEERLNKLKSAEEFLKKSAATEKFGKSWKTHALYGAINLGSGLITWLGFKRTIWEGLASLAINTAVSEVQIWTQPTRSLKNYREYRRLYESGGLAAAFKHKPELYVSAMPGGFGLRLVF